MVPGPVQSQMFPAPVQSQAFPGLVPRPALPDPLGEGFLLATRGPERLVTRARFAGVLLSAGRHTHSTRVRMAARVPRKSSEVRLPGEGRGG